MYILFIDTHQNTNLALFKDDCLINNLNSNELKQSTIIIPLLKTMLEECNVELKKINEIIVVNGPGSFTGVRLGVTIAKTIAYQLNIPIKCLSSLDLIAIMDDYKNHYYGVKDAKGIYLGKNEDGKLSINYKNNNEIKEQDIVTDVTYNYKKLINYFDKLTSIEPHKVNPLYVKKIEAQN